MAGQGIAQRAVQWLSHYWRSSSYWSFQATTETSHHDGGRADATEQILEASHIGKAKNYNENQFAQELYDITLREATEKQWLKGPYTFEEITERVGQQWLPVRRFCVEQKGKLRLIDDFCENR